VCTQDGNVVAAGGSPPDVSPSAKSSSGGGFGAWIRDITSSEWFMPTLLVGGFLFFYWIMTEQAKEQMRWNLNMWNQGPVQTAAPMYNPYLNPNVRGTP
ncbi:MAG: hypothetical protein WCH11_01310, partial [Bdellovibrio sp.]